MAHCPAHDDRNPSLSIRDGNNGKPLLHCFAGCSPEAVIAALRARGLWSEERREWLPAPEYRRRREARRKAEREARELTAWRERQRQRLIAMRNLFWDHERAAEAWLASLEGLAAGCDDKRVLAALRLIAGHLGERLELALEELERMSPVEVSRLRADFGNGGLQHERSVDEG